MKIRNVIVNIFLCAFLLTVAIAGANAALIKNVPQHLVQPNGYAFDCLVSGDEYYHWIHDKNGYVIVQDPKTSFFTYAIKVDGNIVPSEHVVGGANPAALGLEKNIQPDQKVLAQRMTRIQQALSAPKGFPNKIKKQADKPRKSLTNGTFNNIVVFIRFKGDPEFSLTNSRYSEYDDVFNTASRSMKAYYNEVSYNKLTINTGFYPPPAAGQTQIISYQDSRYTRNQLMPYSSSNPEGYANDDEGYVRLLIVLSSAIKYIDSNNMVPDDLDIDANDDGFVDNVVFFAKGSSSDQWADVLWPHMWSLLPTEVKLNGKYVDTYNLQFQNLMLVEVLCHEMFHSLGAPDLYHYYAESAWSSPVAGWDLMEYGTGHMGAYMKYRYGNWIDNIPEITETGTYTLNPMSSPTNNCYKIKSTQANEYFIVEYRQRMGTWEGQLPGTGLLVYRINKSRDGRGNMQAILQGLTSDVPDEVYIYRPEGTRTTNGKPDFANFGVGTPYGYTAINDRTSPSSFLSFGGYGGLNIENISAPGATMSFDVIFNVSTPSINPIGGVYTDPVEVTMGCATTGAIIRYTLDGRTPMETDPAYSTPITVDHSMIVKARAFRNDLQPSYVHAEDFVIGDASMITIGEGTETWEYPLKTSSFTARTQSIYTQAELGTAGIIKSLALDVDKVPGLALNNMTIRIKPTTESSFTAANWGENAGWTTVYRQDTRVGITGWNTFTFETPYKYDGVSNLIVDISFKNSASATSGMCKFTNTGANRTLVYGTVLDEGVPTSWAEVFPTPALSSNVANMRLVKVEDGEIPTCAISTPTVESSYVTEDKNLSLAGIAGDDSGVVGVYWVNSSTGAHGTCNQSPDWNNWTIDGIMLTEGINEISISAVDAAGNAGFDRLRVVCMPTSKLCVVIDQAPGQSDPTGSSPIKFTATFNKPVADFASSDVTVSGLLGAFASISGSGTVYTITVSGMSNSGTVKVDIPSGKVHDGAGLGNAASYNLDNSVYYDKSSVVVTVARAEGQPDPTTSAPVNFSVTFSKPVDDFTASDVVMISSSGEKLNAEVTGTGDVYNIAVTGMTKSGLITVSIPAGSAHDAANIPNVESSGTDNHVLYSDGVGPVAVINQAAAQADPTNSNPIYFQVLFDEPAYNFNEAGITVTSSAGEVLTTTVSGSGSQYNVAVNGVTKPGTITAEIAEGIAEDIAGNASTVNQSTDNIVTFDNVAPSVTVNQASGQVDPTTNAAINFTAVFSEPVEGFSGDDVVLSGSAGASHAAVTGDGSVFNIAVTGMKYTGDVVASIPAGVVSDLAGNIVSKSTSTDNRVIYSDGKPLTVTVNQAAGQKDPTCVGPINFTVEFSKPVDDFTAQNIVVASTAGGTVSKTVTGSGTTYTVGLTGMTSPGKLTVTIPAGAAHDAAGKASLVSTSTDNTVEFNNTRPTVVIEQAETQKDPTNGQSLHFTAVFSTEVSGFEAIDVALSGTAEATTATVTNTGDMKTFDVAVSGMKKSGTVIASIKDGAAEDIAGNTNKESTSTDHEIFYDITPPVVKIKLPSEAASYTRNSTKLNMSGTAEDESEVINQVTWSSYPDSKNGDCIGTTDWKVDGIILNAHTENTVRVCAVDGAGNVGEATALINCELTSPEDIWKGTMMVSLPVIPDYSDPKIVVGFKDNYWTCFDVTTAAWALYPDSKSYLEPRSSTPGRGFWASFPDEYAGDVTGCVPDQTADATLSLSPGWNLIGHPFIKGINWSLDNLKVKIGNNVLDLRNAKFNGYLSDYAWGWKQDEDNPHIGEYYLVYDKSIVSGVEGTLAPWKAYWIKSNVACDLIIPHP